MSENKLTATGLVIGVRYSHSGRIYYQFLIGGLSKDGESYFYYTPMNDLVGHNLFDWVEKVAIIKSDYYIYMYQYN